MDEQKPTRELTDLERAEVERAAAEELPGTGAKRGVFGEPGITGGLGEMGGAGANGGMQPDIAKSHAK